MGMQIDCWYDCVLAMQINNIEGHGAITLHLALIDGSVDGGHDNYDDNDKFYSSHGSIPSLFLSSLSRHACWHEWAEYLSVLLPLQCPAITTPRHIRVVDNPCMQHRALICPGGFRGPC